MLDGLLGGDPQYDATQLLIDEPLVQPPESAPGILLRIRPFKENQGVVDGAGPLQSVHDVTTNFRGEEHERPPLLRGLVRRGKVKFFMHAATEAAADKFRRRVGNNYANSEVFPVDGGAAFPVIDPDEYVAGAWLEMEKFPYYPIRHHNSDEWATDPYGEITSEMLSLDDSTVVTQVVFRPAKQSWTDGDRFKHNSVDDLAHALRQGTSVGWLDPQTRPASQKDKQAAKTIEQQRGQQAFHVNIRVLAASTDKNEAEARARGVAGMFRKYYNAMTEQGPRRYTSVASEREQACEPTPPARRPDGRPRVDRPPDDRDRRRTRRRRPHPEQRDRDAEHRLALHPAWRSGSC